MKLFAIAVALCWAALAVAESSPGAAVAAEPSVEYLPPVGAPEAAQLAEDGYRYKTVRKLRLRHRRAAPSQEYLPPVEAPSQEYLPPATDGVDTKVAKDGYRYKTVRKLKFRARHRRDVSEIAAPSNEYLPPVQVELAPELQTIVGDDGYRYKTVRRLKYRRHRREAVADDGSEVVAIEAAEAAATSKDYLPPVVDKPAASAELAKDGYRYKTVRRIRYRYRH